MLNHLLDIIRKISIAVIDLQVKISGQYVSGSERTD
jgi:hypothetical protein